MRPEVSHTGFHVVEGEDGDGEVVAWFYLLEASDAQAKGDAIAKAKELVTEFDAIFSVVEVTYYRASCELVEAFS